MDETEIYTKEVIAIVEPTEPEQHTKRSRYSWKWLLAILLFIGIISIIFLISNKHTIHLVTLEGEGLGRNYKIQYRAMGGPNYKLEVDNLLNEIQQTLDSYTESSDITSFNNYNCEPFYYNSPLFYPLLVKSKEVYTKSQGAFDPTVAPIVSLWKSKLREGSQPNYLEIQSLKEYVGLDYIVVNQSRVKRLKEGVKIDFSSVIPGYAIDIIANFLQSKGVKDLCIEFGSETIAFGTNKNQAPWQITHTIADGRLIANPLSIQIPLTDKALSITKKNTPWEREQTLRIIIDPQTGYPPTGNIIASFVFAKDCMTASAYATAIITMNFTAVLEMLTKAEDITVFLIYKDYLGELKFYNSEGLKIHQEEDSQEIKIEPNLVPNPNSP